MLYEQLDRQSFDRFAIVVNNVPINDTFWNQLENHRRTVGSGSSQTLAALTWLKIVFGEEARFSHRNGALSSGKVVELKSSIRSCEHRTLSIEINLHEHTAEGFTGERIDDRSAQGVFVVVRILRRDERGAVVGLRGCGADHNC